MAKERTSVRMQAQIKIMSEQGHSIRSIARVLRLSRRTVRKYLEPAPQPPTESGGWEEIIDWDYLRQEVYGKGTTVKQIGQEVSPSSWHHVTRCLPTYAGFCTGAVASLSPDRTLTC